jgi:hypothetical protein
MEILLVVLNHLWPVIGGILAILLAAGAKKLMDKWGIDRSEKIDNMIDVYVGKGVDYAEVVARKYASENGIKMAGGSKKAKAVNVVMEELKQSGITGVAEELVVARIESWLEVKGHKPGIPTDPESPGESA